MPKTPDRSKQIKEATAERYREVYIHSKLMIIDDSMFTLGSANLNLRSFAVDSEINIASDNAEKATDLRQRVWKQHSKKFDGGCDATNQTVMSKTFDRWEKEAQDNFDLKKGVRLSHAFSSSFLMNVPAASGLHEHASQRTSSLGRTGSIRCLRHF